MKNQIYLEGFLKLVTELYSYHGHEIQSTTRVDDYSVDLLIKSKKGEDWLTRCSIRTRVDDDSINSLILARSRRQYSKCAFISAGVFTEDAEGLANENDVHLLDGDEFQNTLHKARTQKPEAVPTTRQAQASQQKFSITTRKLVFIALGVITVLCISVAGLWLFTSGFNSNTNTSKSASATETKKAINAIYCGDEDVTEYVAFILFLAETFDTRRSVVRGINISNVDDDWLEDTYNEAMTLVSMNNERPPPRCLWGVHDAMGDALYEWQFAWSMARFRSGSGYYEYIDKFDFKINIVEQEMEKAVADIEFK